MQQQFDESRDSNTCEQNRQQQPNDNLQLRSKLERTKRREKSLERQLDLQLARIAMVRTGIQQIIRNKTASNSVLSIARLIEQNTLSDVKEEHPIRLKTEFVCKNEYVELFIKEEKYQEEEDTNVEYKDTSQPAEIIPNNPQGLDDMTADMVTNMTTIFSDSPARNEAQNEEDSSGAAATPPAPDAPLAGPMGAAPAS